MLTKTFAAMTRGATLLRAWLLLGLVVSLTGCANFYVDSKVPEIPVAALQKPAQPQPVQLIFEFQTKGAPNQTATAHLKARVTEQVRASGVFSEVTEGPAPGGAMLSIVLDNVPMSDSTFAKGFATGLTFGLVGSEVGDGYVCTASYRSSVTAEPIVKKARHAIYTTLGAKGAPADSIKAAGIEDAISRVTRTVVSQVLNDVTHDAAFH